MTEEAAQREGNEFRAFVRSRLEGLSKLVTEQNGVTQAIRDHLKQLNGSVARHEEAIQALKQKSAAAEAVDEALRLDREESQQKRRLDEALAELKKQQAVDETEDRTRREASKGFWDRAWPIVVALASAALGHWLFK
jgi:regulator of replication initiation timing